MAPLRGTVVVSVFSPHELVVAADTLAIGTEDAGLRVDVSKFVKVGRLLVAGAGLARSPQSRIVPLRDFAAEYDDHSSTAEIARRFADKAEAGLTDYANELLVKNPQDFVQRHIQQRNHFVALLIFEVSAGYVGRTILQLFAEIGTDGRVRLVRELVSTLTFPTGLKLEMIGDGARAIEPQPPHFYDLLRSVNVVAAVEYLVEEATRRKPDTCGGAIETWIYTAGSVDFRRVR